MSDESPRKATRRAVLATIGAAGGGAAIANALTGEQGDLYGGQMALDKAYKVGERLWIGPDSARSNVAAEDGRVFIGASGDGYTFYNGDGGAWDSKGLGDSSNPLASVTTEEIVGVSRVAANYPGATGGEKIKNALDDLPGSGGTVVVGPEGPDDVSASTGSLSGRDTAAWEITQELTVNDYQTLLLVNAYLFATDGLDAHLIRYEDEAATTESFSIIGLGDAIIDGNATNQNRSTQNAKFCTLDFQDGNRLSINNVTLRNPAAFNVRTRAVDNLTANVHLDHDGGQNNQDGIHVYGPATDIDISVSGDTTDDAVAIDSRSATSAAFLDNGGGDITDVRIHDSSFATRCRLIAGDGNYISKVTVDDCTSFGDHCVIIGEATRASSFPSNSELANITITGCSNQKGNAVVEIASPSQNIVVSGCEADRADLLRVSENTGSHRVDGGSIRGSGAAYRVESGNTATAPAISGVTLDSLGGTTSDGIIIKGTVTDGAFSDLLAADAGTVVDVTGSATGTLRDLTVSSATTVFSAVDSLTPKGGLPPVDVTMFANIQGAKAYNDGTVGKEGPAYNDGTGWASTVDDTAI